MHARVNVVYHRRACCVTLACTRLVSSFHLSLVSYGVYP